MAKIQAVWALDVGQAALKALKLVPGETDETVVAEAFDYIEYPKILSQPDADAEQLVREALGTFLERNDLKGCRVAIAVPGQAGLVKFIKLPPVEKKRIPDIVKFEARQQIPFALEEVIWDYQQIGGDDEDGGDEDFTMAEVGLFAMKRDQINRAILPFAVVGIEVDVVQMGPIALYNYVTYDRMKGPEKLAEKGSVVLLDIGADNTDLIISDGTRIWQRNVPIGGNHFTRSLTKELKLTFAKGEHLKRNATKAPDPRAVFTAMRGVFNDLASEVNRSIGFYSSVNRTAKIVKVVGLGNGFKLPGLQKFLQQNLSYDVEKLEGFSRLTGDEVINAPQFQENLPSFAVAYGLALQALSKSQLRTNLLPPEIEQVRMVRRKKPWALAASVLLMLGFSALFLGDWKLWAKVNNPGLLKAAETAKTVKTQGDNFKNEFKAAEDAWTAEKGVGEKLVVDTSEQARWPSFLQVLSTYLPNPVRDLRLDPNNPKDQATLDKLRVHIDAIKPVWRNDVNAEWYAGLSQNAKNFMHPLDRATEPKDKGWIIQLVGHHYNPNPTKGPAEKYDMGPLPYLVGRNGVLSRLWHPSLRSFGVHHATLTGYQKDTNWTNEREGAGNESPLSSTLLARATPPKGGEGGGAAGGGAASGIEGYSQSSAGASSGGYGNSMKGYGASSGGVMGRGYGASSGGYGPGMAGGGMGGVPTSDAAKSKATFLTRTDFVIQLVWQPLAADETPKDTKEIQAELRKAEEATKGATPAVNEEELEKATKEAQKQAEARQQQALEQAKQRAAGSAPGTPAGTPSATPGAPPPAAPRLPGTPAPKGTPLVPPAPKKG